MSEQEASHTSNGDVTRDGLARASPSAVGVDAASVLQCLERLQSSAIDLHSFVLHRHGHVAVELYWWPYRPDRLRLMHSVAKSFTSCAVGMAVAEGRLSLTGRVLDFFPEYAPQSPDPKLAAMTVEDLLTMRTGHAQETSGAAWRGLTTSWIREFFEIPVVYAPGSVYQYTSAASYMLSAILTRITGRTLHEYLRPRLFEPLGIADELWDVGPDGINPGGNGLRCKTVDVLKLGVLHAERGMWKGQRLLSESWVTDATRAHSEGGYGYHWWAGPNRSFSAMGVFGQLLVVYPDQLTTLAITAAVNDGQACTRRILPVLHQFFPAALTGPVQNCEDSESRLRQLAKRIAIPRPLTSPQPPAESPASLEYRIDPNSLGISSVHLELHQDRCTLSILDAQGPHFIEMGMGTWLESATDMPGRDLHHGYDMRPARVVAGAQWLDARTLQMSWIFVESAFQDTVICHFDADHLRLERRVNVNSGSLLHPPLLGRRSA